MRYASFFSGAGGLDLGAKRLGLKPALVTDVNRDCVSTVREGLGFPERCAFIEADVRELLNGGLLRQPWASGLGLVIGGPPCQGFSVAGYMDPYDQRSELVFEFMNVISQVRPAAFLMENVPGLAGKRWQLVMSRLTEKAERLDYDVHHLVLDAQYYGVAQRRKRLFLFGMPKGCTPAVPEASAGMFTVRDVVDNLPRSIPDVFPSVKVSLARNPVLRKSPYAGLLVNGGGRIINLDDVAPTLPASMGANRTPVIDLDQLEHDKKPWIEGYHADLMDGEPPLAEIPGYVRMRRLSMNECAALQAFPYGYPFHGSLSSRWSQIGNAVPPPLALAAVQALLGGLR